VRALVALASGWPHARRRGRRWATQLYGSADPERTAALTGSPYNYSDGSDPNYSKYSTRYHLWRLQRRLTMSRSRRRARHTDPGPSYLSRRTQRQRIPAKYYPNNETAGSTVGTLASVRALLTDSTPETPAASRPPLATLRGRASRVFGSSAVREAKSRGLPAPVARCSSSRNGNSQGTTSA